MGSLKPPSPPMPPPKPCCTPLPTPTKPSYNNALPPPSNAATPASCKKWLQDSNWLVAAPLAEILRPHQQAFDAEIAAVLRGDDAVWKTSLLAGLLDCRAGEETVRAAERIARCPTAAERAEGADEAVRDFLARRAG